MIHAIVRLKNQQPYWHVHHVRQTYYSANFTFASCQQMLSSKLSGKKLSPSRVRSDGIHLTLRWKFVDFLHVWTITLDINFESFPRQAASNEAVETFLVFPHHWRRFVVQRIQRIWINKQIQPGIGAECYIILRFPSFSKAVANMPFEINIRMVHLHNKIAKNTSACIECHAQFRKRDYGIWLCLEGIVEFYFEKRSRHTYTTLPWSPP